MWIMFLILAGVSQKAHQFNFDQGGIASTRSGGPCSCRICSITRINGPRGVTSWKRTSSRAEARLPAKRSVCSKCFAKVAKGGKADASFVGFKHIFFQTVFHHRLPGPSRDRQQQNACPRSWRINCELSVVNANVWKKGYGRQFWKFWRQWTKTFTTRTVSPLFKVNLFSHAFNKKERKDLFLEYISVFNRAHE